MTFSSFIHRHSFNNFDNQIWDPNLSFLGLANWLPFFWLFWALQPFLNNKYKRRNLGLILISGSFPVIFTGFGQYFFNWYGPFDFLNVNEGKKSVFGQFLFLPISVYIIFSSRSNFNIINETK